MTHLAATYYLIEIFGLLMAILVGWGTARLFKTKTIKDIVSTANDTINLYESKDKAQEMKINLYEAKDKAQEMKIDELEGKIDGLVSQVATLQSSLDKALAQNELLQKLLLKAGEGDVTLPVGEPPVGSNESSAPSNAS